MKAIAIIPARGGSKRIPKKNIKNFLGKPLIAYSIEKALASGLFEKVVVTTDDEAVAKIAQEYGAEIPFLRPKELSGDFVGSGAAVEHALKFLQEQGEEYEYLCTLYATAPLLDICYLQEGLQKLQESDACMSFSVTSMPFPIQRSFYITKDNRCKMFTPKYYTSRSQDLKEAYQDAGQFYWRRIGKKMQDVPFGCESIPVVLPRHLVQDIDTPEDWKRAEMLYQLVYPDKFDEWNKLKKKLHNKREIIRFKESEVYFLSIGQNIGYESYGKKELFLRPVLVFRKLNKQTFLGIPLTSKEKKGSYYFTFSYKQGKKSTAMLHQMRVFDIRRSEYYSGKISKNTMKNLKDKVSEFMGITSSKEEEDRPTRAK